MIYIILINLLGFFCLFFVFFEGWGEGWGGEGGMISMLTYTVAV